MGHSHPHPRSSPNTELLRSIINLSSVIIPQPELVPVLFPVLQCLCSHKERLVEMANVCCPCQTDSNSLGCIPGSCLSHRHFEALPLPFPLCFHAVAEGANRCTLQRILMKVPHWHLLSGRDRGRTVYTLPRRAKLPSDS